MTHAAVALATRVEQAWPHVRQLSTSLVVSTQLPLQIVEADDGQPEAHEYEAADPTHAGVPPPHALPQLPQLAVLVNWTQAPLQSVYPVSHANVHALLTHTAWALATLVVQASPHPLQLFASLVGSTQLPLQSVGAADGHPDKHEYMPPEPAHTGVLPLHALPQLAQLMAVVYWTHSPPQRLKPALHASEHVPSVHVGWALAMEVVHNVPHVPQVEGLVRSTHCSPQAASPAGQPPSAVGDDESSPESAGPPSSDEPSSEESPGSAGASDSVASSAAPSRGLVMGPPSAPTIPVELYPLKPETWPHPPGAPTRARRAKTPRFARKRRNDTKSIYQALPRGHCAEHIGIPGLASWQCMPSQSVPVPVHGPLPLHWFCVESLMHLPLTAQALSFVHQQHWFEPPHWP